IGKVYSMDAMARTSGGKTVARTFVQGSSSDDLITIAGKLAEKLLPELSKHVASVQPQVTAAPANSDFIRRKGDNVRYQSSGFIVRPEEFVQGSKGGWVSKRLPGAANLLAVGSKLINGQRQVFLSQDRKVVYYLQGDKLNQVASVEYRPHEQIVGLDSIDTDGDGVDEVYVSIVRNDELASQVFKVQGNKLVLIAKDTPYFFRSIALAGGKRKLYAQEMGVKDQDYYGDVHQVVLKNTAIVKRSVIKMPRHGNIHSFNQFRDKDGNLMTIVINKDNYLVVYDGEIKEIWRSNDAFGGTELFYLRPDPDNARVTGDNERWVFLNQRIQVTSRQEILVGRNDGMFVLGNARSYKKGAVYNLRWDGSSLEEVWRTKETQSYMPDYWYDEHHNELLILQMPKKPGPGVDGASSLAIKKVE
ncbi:MAG TPA: VCBS repeat-containing protein, partial [Deltaproteobacteria bacterium]|nr:VCBS repeat-containing protein [Deltaproteobacteria bacterium]